MHRLSSRNLRTRVTVQFALMREASRPRTLRFSMIKKHPRLINSTVRDRVFNEATCVRSYVWYVHLFIIAYCRFVIILIRSLCSSCVPLSVFSIAGQCEVRIYYHFYSVCRARKILSPTSVKTTYKPREAHNVGDKTRQGHRSEPMPKQHHEIIISRCAQNSCWRDWK